MGVYGFGDNTCNTYCKNQGSGSMCLKAQKNTDSDTGKCTRDVTKAEGCDQVWDDQICVCTRKGTLLSKLVILRYFIFYLGYKYFL